MILYVWYQIDKDIKERESAKIQTSIELDEKLDESIDLIELEHSRQEVKIRANSNHIRFCPPSDSHSDVLLVI